MSVSCNDPSCTTCRPGAADVARLAEQIAGAYLRRPPLKPKPRTVLLSVTNPNKDRRLAGKARRRARRAA